MIYNQQDKSDEVFFILSGRIKLFTDLNNRSSNTEEGLDMDTLVGFNLYVEGTIFGDSDVFAKLDRDSTAIAMHESNLLILVKKDLKRILRSDPKIEQEMLDLAKKRRENHVEKMCTAILNSPNHTDML